MAGIYLALAMQYIYILLLSLYKLIFIGSGGVCHSYTWFELSSHVNVTQG